MGNRPQSVEAQAYYAIAEELSDPNTKLTDLDEKSVAVAKAWAKKSHRRWPPRPRTSGWQVQVWSL